jgi:hypothetical protein
MEKNIGLPLVAAIIAGGLALTYCAGSSVTETPTASDNVTAGATTGTTTATASAPPPGVIPPTQGDANPYTTVTATPVPAPPPVPPERPPCPDCPPPPGVWVEQPQRPPL